MNLSNNVLLLGELYNKYVDLIKNYDLSNLIQYLN